MRNPTFVAATAPDPVAAMNVVACNAERTAEEIQPLYADRVRVHTIQASSDLERGVCAFFKARHGAVLSDHFEVAPSLALLVRGAAQYLHVRSLYVPVAEVETLCYQPTDQVLDENGAPIAQIRSARTECGNATTVNLYGLLFSESGELLWTSRTPDPVERNNPTDVDRAFLDMVAQVPAIFSEIAPPPKTATELPPPAQDSR